MAARPARGQGFRVLPGVVLAGFLLGLAEGAWHSFGVQPAAGYPGDTGPSLWAHAWLDLNALAWPALAVAVVTWPFRYRVVVALAWIAALFPTLFLFVDLVVHTRTLEGFALAAGGWPHVLRVAPWAVGAGVVAIPVAVWLDARLRRLWEPRLGPIPILVATVLVAFAPIVFLGSLPVSAPAPRAGGGDHPNVLLLTIDTLRQDEVGRYGGPPTPHLDALLASGVTVGGWSPASWTRPSFGALFSGLPTTGNGGEKETRIVPGVDWWPERLAEAGYVTQAFVTNPNLLPRYGFERGFQGWDHSEELERLDPVIRSAWVYWYTRRVIDKGDPRRGDVVVDRARNWLTQTASTLDAPWFLWVHLMDPHLPYHLRGEDGRLVDPDPPAWLDALDGDLESDGAFHALMDARDGSRVTTPEAREALHRLYRREVQFADTQVGRLLEQVPAGTMWVLASDHGEEFWEHGGFEHGHALIDEVLRVPLGFGGPGILPGGWAGDMALQDVGPTLMSLLGLEPLEVEARSGLLPGDEPLHPWTLGRDRSEEVLNAAPEPGPCRPPRLLAEGMLYGPSRTRVLRPDGTGWERHDPSGTWTAAGSCGTDPAGPVPPGEITDLVRLLDLWRERNAERATPVDVDPQLLESLRAVGYVE